MFGSFHTRGLINCLYSEELINIVLNTAKMFNVDVNSNAAQTAVSNRLSHLNIKKEIISLYNSPPLPKTLQPLDVSEIKLTEDELSDDSLNIPQEDIDILQDNIEILLHRNFDSDYQVDSKFRHSKLNEHNKIVINNNDTINYYVYDVPSINSSHYNVNHIEKLNQITLDFYKTSFLIHRIIKNNNLDYLIAPKTRLLSLKYKGKEFYLLAMQNLPILYEDDSYQSDNNKIPIAQDSKPAIMQLLKLNTYIGLNIHNSSNIFRLDDPEYKLALINVSSGKSVDALFGDHNGNGIMDLAYSEQMLDEIILEYAKYGYLEKDKIIRNKNNCFPSIKNCRLVQDFYTRNNISSESLINNNPEELSAYLDLDLEISTKNVEYFEEKGITNISIRNAARDIINELNRCLKEEILPFISKHESIISKRFIYIDFNKNKMLCGYKQVYINAPNKNTNKSISCFDLVREALIAKGCVLSCEFQGRYSRFDRSLTYLHL